MQNKRKRIPAATLVAFYLASGVIGVAFAQTTPPPTKDSPNATGRTTIPEKKDQGQPRGDEGPAGTPADATAPSRRQGGAAVPAAPESGRKNN
jgi:hypothetical protein